MARTTRRAGTPGYVQRFARITRALQILSMHPDGLPLTRLAAMVDADEGRLRDEIVTYYRAEIDPEYGDIAYHRVRIGFFGPRGDEEVEPAQAEVVRVFSSDPAAEIGVTHVTLGQLARIYRAGTALLAAEPDNATLAEALQILDDVALAGVEPPTSYGVTDLTGLLRGAIEQRRAVSITYTPVWNPRVRDHVIQPHRLVNTRRGWEVDAGVVGRDGTYRVLSFLLSGVRAASVLEDTFERPAEVDALIAANRQERAVDVVVPQQARWAVERQAESVEVLQEDEESVKLRAHLLPPVQDRLGLIMLVAGEDGFVVEPAEFVDAGPGLAARLLAHHGDLPRP
jgi:hypothetical protein